MKKGFTLAEVLITLGIICVVAAMTIPMLVAKYQQKQLLTMAKVDYTILNNAIERAKSEYGTDVNNWIFLGGSTDVKSQDFTERYLKPYLNVVQYCKKININGSKDCSWTGDLLFYDNNTTLLILANSTKMRVVVAEGIGGSIINRVQITYDVNGDKKPNKYGKDRFVVELGGGAYTNSIKDRNKFLPYQYIKSKPCDFYKSISDMSQAHSCTQDGGRTACLAYLFCNGWEMPKDYPW